MNVMVVPARGGIGRSLETQANTIACEIARRLCVTKANVRYLRAAANGKKPKSTYRYRKPRTVCPYSASCFTCPLPDCVIPACQIVNLLTDDFVYRPDD